MAIEAREKMLTTIDVASMFGVKPDTVRKWVQRELIRPDRMIGTAHIFLQSECDRFRRIKRKAGNPALLRRN